MAGADLMHRNLDRRFELLIRVADEAQRAELRELIGLAMDSRIASWWLEPDGTWTRHHLDESGSPLTDVQDLLIRSRRVRGADGGSAGGRGGTGPRRGSAAPPPPPPPNTPGAHPH